MTRLLGHDAQAAAFLAAMQGERMHHGWILAGRKGLGKASFAHAAATRLLAEAAGPAPLEPGLEVRDDHRIAQYLAAGSHPDFMELKRLPREKSEELARNITVDQIRGLQRMFATRPSLSERRVIIIDAADDMERGAANALLKSLEEPPAGTIFLLVTHAIGRLLPTIRSRCRVLRFSPLSEADMRTALRGQLPEADPREIDVLARAGEGSPGQALTFAGLGLDVIDDALEAIARDGDPGNARRIDLAKQLSPKSAKPRYDALLDRVPAFLSAHAKQRQGERLAAALSAWEAARTLAAIAPTRSLDPASVVFELCGHVATLADERQGF